MVNTWNRNVNAENNNAANHNAENNNAANPPLTLEQVLMMQAQMLQTISNPWSTCRMLNPKHHHRRQGINLETFSAPSHLLSHIPWNPWMPMTGSKM
jgi:hypothetical protein